MNEDNEGFLCEANVSFEATDLDFLWLITYVQIKQFENSEV